MERMVMHTADRMVDAAAARLRDLVASIWSAPAAALVPVSPCPSHVAGSCAYGTHVHPTQNWDVDGTVKPGTTGAFRLFTGPSRRQSERSP